MKIKIIKIIKKNVYDIENNKKKRNRYKMIKKYHSINNIPNKCNLLISIDLSNLILIRVMKIIYVIFYYYES